MFLEILQQCHIWHMQHIDLAHLGSLCQETVSLTHQLSHDFWSAYGGLLTAVSLMGFVSLLCMTAVGKR